MRPRMRMRQKKKTHLSPDTSFFRRFSSSIMMWDSEGFPLSPSASTKFVRRNERGGGENTRASSASGHFFVMSSTTSSGRCPSSFSLDFKRQMTALSLYSIGSIVHRRVAPAKDVHRRGAFRKIFRVLSYAFFVFFVSRHCVQIV